MGSSIVEETIDLNQFGFEVYDLMTVERTDSWPVLKALDYKHTYEQSWLHRVENVLEEIQRTVPKHETILLVDNDWLGISNNIFHGNKCLPFLEKNGVAWGSPPDDEAAIKELNRMREEMQAGYIVIGWTSFWWFDVYPHFIQYLRDHFDHTLENEDVVVFHLLEKIPAPLEFEDSSRLIMHE